MRSLLKDVANFIYPPRCIVCGSIAPPVSIHFCDSCLAELEVLTVISACTHCGAPLGEGAECAHCAGKGLFPLEKVAGLGPFRDPLRKLLHQMKFHHRWVIAEILGRQMIQQKRIVEILNQTDVLVPIPLFWSRQISRGYNQAESVTRQLSSPGGARILHPLARVKNTEPQTTVRSAADRASNVRNAFSLKRRKGIAGKRITLVDDVMTTGSTLRSAARELSKADPQSIRAIVVAVADPKHRDFSSA